MRRRPLPAHDRGGDVGRRPPVTSSPLSRGARVRVGSGLRGCSDRTASQEAAPSRLHTDLGRLGPDGAVDGAGLTKTLLQYDTPQRIAAVARAGFTPTAAKRRLAGGTPAVYYALVNGAPAILFVVGDHVVGAVGFDIADGKIAAVRGIAAPTRLARLAEAWRQQEPDTPLITEW